MIEGQKEKKGLNINAKSFISALLVLLVLMIVTYISTFFVPGGSFQRIDDVIVEGSYALKDGGLPFWKFILSPFLVLGSDGGVTIIAVIAFLIVVGGIFNCLDKGNLMQYMLDKIVYKFRDSRYKLLAVVSFFFMFLGAFIGSFEECVPLVPFAVAIAVSIGWDALTGLGMSLLSIGCGFAAGVTNPFTVGVAQELAGLKMMSGIWYRLVAFVLIYILLFMFLLSHAKRIEKTNSVADRNNTFTFKRDEKMEKAVSCFAIILLIGILTIVSSSFISVLRDITMPIVAVIFLVAGTVSSFVSGMGSKKFFKEFWNGAVSISPAILMILMASSIKYILTESNTLDTLLYRIMNLTSGIPDILIILFIYAIALIMNFFISSGSAKAFLLIPLLVPIADTYNISRQLSVMAYAFGDGFSNVFYVTNPVLLISLGLAGISYGKWVKWSWKFQLLNLILTSGILLLGYAIKYS